MQQRDIEKIRGEIAKITERYNLSLVLLFGSQASGFTHRESDVDVAYSAHKKLSFEDEISLNSDLIEVFKNDAISLVNLKTAPPLLLKQIVTNAIVLYEKTPHLFTELFLYAMRTFEEARAIFDLREHHVNRKIDEYKHAG